MKRYLAFFGAHYYPAGGMYDLLNDFDTIDECKNAIDKKVIEDFIPDDGDTIEEHLRYQWEYRWANIYDTKTKKEVWSK